ncbi:hypothetical protein V8C35DRAFT_286065 [Trichoderma chlorosporum]
MPSRRVHTKSRHGCSACKARRVRCDLRLPECSHCIRRNETCSLGRDRSRRYSPGDNPARPALSDSTGYLLEQFASCVSTTISDKPECQQVWASLTFNRDAPYLTHSVISISALYAARTHQHLSKAEIDNYLYLAAFHQTTAVSLLGPEIINLHEQNCDAVFATASLLFLGATASTLSQQGMRPRRVAEISELARGVYAVAREAPINLKAGPFRPLVDIEYRDIKKALPSELRLPLLRLTEAIQSSQESTAKKQVYLSAVHLLDKVMRWNVYSACRTLIVFVWLGLVDRSFMELAVAQDPLALRIIGQFGVYSMQARSAWWLKGLAESITYGMLGSIKDLES